LSRRRPGILVAAAGALLGALVAVVVTRVAGPGGRTVRIVDAPLGGLGAPSEWTPPPIADGPVRNLILAIGDGMGLSELEAARLRALGRDGRFVLERLPVVGLHSVAPEGRLVPNSQAAATALASGRAIANGAIALGPDGERLESIAERFHTAGAPVGLVTTHWIYDATPAAFGAHVGRRSDHGAIVDQLSASGFDLLLGGGVAAFDGPADAPGGTPLERARAKGIAIARDASELEAANRLPLWGLLPGKTLGTEPRHPELDDLVATALRLLPPAAAERGTGFFLLFEEEAIDTAGHAEDLEGLAGAVLRFDRAVERAARFAAADGETLLVVTADHPTGGVVIEDDGGPSTLRVVWASGKHSGAPAPVFAYGPEGAARRLAGVRSASEVGRLLVEIAGPAS